jgi:hypothetical protein
MKQLGAALEETGKVPPRFRTILLERGGHTLNSLLNDGLSVLAGRPGKKGGGRTRVRFKKVGKEFCPRRDTGWMAVKVKSAFGAVSVLLLDEGGGVSGLLKLKR